MKYRIARRDARNWTIERWREGGHVISRGRFAGQIAKEGWDTVNPHGYYPKLEHAVSGLFNLELGEAWPSDGWTGQDLTAAIAAAEVRVLEAIGAIDTGPVPTSIGASVNPAAEFTEEQKATVRDARDPVVAYLRITGGKRFKRTSDETSRKLSPKDAALERVR